MMKTEYWAELEIDDQTGEVHEFHAHFRDVPCGGVDWRSWGCEVQYDADGTPIGVTIREPVNRHKLRDLMQQFGKDGQFVMNTVPNGLLIDFSVYPKAVKLGPCETSKCPGCGNSLQNCHPAQSQADLLRCASCKLLFLRADDDEHVYEGQIVPAGVGSRSSTDN